MLILFIFFTSMMTIKAQQGNLKVKDNRASIETYPHSAFLSVICIDHIGAVYEPWHCGSSLVNQQILLTAGHCVTPCDATIDITINMGDENKERGIVRSGENFFIHEDFNDVTLDHDIALIKMSVPVSLTWKVRRVAIMKQPPYNEPASIAGWGLNEENKKYLIKVDQTVRNNVFCEKMFKKMPEGTLCASSDTKKRGPTIFDSGSALVVQGYIQIGLMSFKSPGNGLFNVIAYTDIGYYYDWIEFNSHRLYCP